MSSHLTNTNFMLIRKQRCTSFLYALTKFQRPIQLGVVAARRTLPPTDAISYRYFPYMFLMYATVKLQKKKFITCIYKN
jgi:hypothetical protein